MKTSKILLKLTIEKLHDKGATKYWLMKKCLQCYGITEVQQERCPSCKHLFVQEATPEERQEIEDKLSEMQKKFEEDKDIKKNG